MSGLLSARSGLALSLGSGGRVGCLPGLDPAFLPLFGAPGPGVWLSLAPVGPAPWFWRADPQPHAVLSPLPSGGAPPWNVLGLPAPCAQGLQVGGGWECSLPLSIL